MSNQIHHATLKFVSKFGCEIVKTQDALYLRNLTTGLLSEDGFDSAGEISEELHAHGIDQIVWDEPQAPAFGLSSGVMVLSFYKEYSMSPDGPGCGDDLDVVLRNETRLFDDEGNDLDAMDRARLIAIATECGVWRDSWSTLNNGMARMNASNRLRAWLRNNAGPLTIGKVTGRFGITQAAPKGKAARAETTEALAA